MPHRNVVELSVVEAVTRPDTFTLVLSYAEAQLISNSIYKQAYHFSVLAEKLGLDELDRTSVDLFTLYAKLSRELSPKASEDTND